MRLPGKVVVVLDILFATSTMVTALAHGAKEVIPVLDGGAARARAKGLDDGSYVLSGELYAETLPGFAHPAPLALLEHGVKGKTVIYSTTNGTVAMTQPARAARCTAARCSMRARSPSTSWPGMRARPCSSSAPARATTSTSRTSTARATSSSAFSTQVGDLSDAAKAALTIYRHAKAPEALLDCRVGRMMVDARPGARGGVRLPPRCLSGGAGAGEGRLRLVT